MTVLVHLNTHEKPYLGRVPSPFVAATFALAAAAVLCCGCSGRDPARQSILKVGNGAEVQNMDPHLVSGVTEHRVLSSLFEGLANMDAATMAPVPGAAESWTISDDKRVYTFVLRHDGRWSNGEPVTARDFVYSWRRMLSPGLAAEYAYLLHCLKNGKAFNEGKITDFNEVGVKALDDYTLEVTLENPTPYFLGMQIHYAWFPVHRAAIEKFGKMDERDTAWTRPGNFVCNGPFGLAEWWPNEVLRVTRNPFYWNAAAVRLDGIEYYPIDNLQTEERSFRAGELQITSDIPLSKVEVYRRKHPELLNTHPYCGVYFYRMNVTRPPFTDKRVRQAFSLALDREQLVHAVLKGGEPAAYSLTPPNTGGYSSAAKVSFDVERARSLLAEAGYPDGKGLPPVEILYNTSENHKRIAEAIQRMWRQTLNADVRLMNQDWKVYLSSLNTLDFHMARSSWIADVLDPVNFLECFLTNGGNNRTGWSSPDFDRLIGQAYAEADESARVRLLQEAEAILLEESPIIPIYFYVWKFLKAPELKGLTPNPLGYFRWTDLYLEEKTP